MYALSLYKSIISLHLSPFLNHSTSVFPSLLILPALFPPELSLSPSLSSSVPIPVSFELPPTPVPPVFDQPLCPACVRQGARPPSGNSIPPGGWVGGPEAGGGVCPFGTPCTCNQSGPGQDPGKQMGRASEEGIKGVPNMNQRGGQQAPNQGRQLSKYGEGPLLTTRQLIQDQFTPAPFLQA